jgi:hypothetical protein
METAADSGSEQNQFNLGIDLPSDVLALAAQPDQNRMPSKICE